MLPVSLIILLLTGFVTPWNVTQFPEFISAHEQTQLNLECTFDQRSPKPTAVTFMWSWNNVSVYGFTSKRGTNGSNITELQDPRVSLETDWEGTSNLTIRNSMPGDNGLYVCLVIIHTPLPITTGKGKGTRVFVLKNPEKDQRLLNYEKPEILTSCPDTTPPLRMTSTDPTMTSPSTSRHCFLSVPLCVVLFPLFLVIVLSMCGGSLIYLKMKPHNDN
ncbi:uncharacterized protein [Aquarana catesbeiana]|uniref:uncharacterized protein n=1 Tax=Aquarana catesbeiana TaxID=8400 RepID=UPI003CC97294